MDVMEVTAKNNKILDISTLNYPGISEVEEELKFVLYKSEGLIRDMCMSLLKSGGKRLRPLMVINSSLCFSDLNASIVETAVAAELIHMASLVHDDIIDVSESRRGMRTINSFFGNHAAVLTGDFLFAEAFSMLSSYKLIKSMGYLVAAIREMCDGEIKQAGDKFKTGVTISDYFNRIAKKTGILISSCCSAGAAAANASDSYIEAMNGFGMNVGYAFQIMDDILDFTGDPKKLGKPTGIDLKDGNITLPVILLLQDNYYGLWVKKIIEKQDISKCEIGYISELLNKTGAIKKSCEIARECINKAKSNISIIPSSIYKDILNEIADNVITREN